MRAPMEVAEHLLQQLPNLKVIEHFLEFAEHVIVLTLKVCISQPFYQHFASAISNKFTSPTTPQKITGFP